MYVSVLLKAKLIEVGLYDLVEGIYQFMDPGIGSADVHGDQQTIVILFQGGIKFDQWLVAINFVPTVE